MRKNLSRHPNFTSRSKRESVAERVTLGGLAHRTNAGTFLRVPWAKPASVTFLRNRSSRGLFALEPRDRHLPIEFHAELVVDGVSLLAVAVGGHLDVPAQQVVRPALAQIDAVRAQFRRGLAQDDAD